jgi:hypothetical protein
VASGVGFRDFWNLTRDGRIAFCHVFTTYENMDGYEVRAVAIANQKVTFSPIMNGWSDVPDASCSGLLAYSDGIINAGDHTTGQYRMATSTWYPGRFGIGNWIVEVPLDEGPYHITHAVSRASWPLTPHKAARGTTIQFRLVSVSADGQFVLESDRLQQQDAPEPGWKSRLRSLPVLGGMVPDTSPMSDIYNRAGHIVAQLPMQASTDYPPREMISPDGHSVLVASPSAQSLQLYVW